MSKTIFVTGATSGIGRACALRFAREGWGVVATGRRRDRLDALAKDLVPAPVHILALDARDNKAMEQAVADLPPQFKEVDVLVNNAGLALGIAPAHQCSLDDWEAMIDTNIKGLLYATRAIVPGMVERGRGHVVNIGSVAGSWPYAGGNVYGSTKAFVQQFSRNLKTDLHGTGIRVTNLEPGMVETEFSLVRYKGDGGKAGEVYSDADPMRPEDMAEIIWFAVNLPQRVNITTLEVMSANQSWGGLRVHKG